MRKKYPWDEWENGEKHTVKISDYATPKNFRSILYTRAHRRNIYVWAHVDGDQITFQFADSPERLDKPKQELDRWADGTIKGMITAPFTCAICNAPIRPEWPGKVCHVKTDTPTPDAWLSPSGSSFIPKH